MNARRTSAAILALLSLCAVWTQRDALVSHADHDPTHRVDINAAQQAELEALPRIGPAIAAAIVASRESDGPFADIDELDRVPRIGPKTVEGLRPYATVR